MSHHGLLGPFAKDLFIAFFQISVGHCLNTVFERLPLANRLIIERSPQLGVDGIAVEIALTQVTIEKRVDLRNVQVLVLNRAFFLRIHHETDDFVDLIGHQVVFGEDIKPELFVISVEPVVHLP